MSYIPFVECVEDDRDRQEDHDKEEDKDDTDNPSGDLGENVWSIQSQPQGGSTGTVVCYIRRHSDDCSCICHLAGLITVELLLPRMLTCLHLFMTCEEVHVCAKSETERVPFQCNLINMIRGKFDYFHKILYCMIQFKNLCNGLLIDFRIGLNNLTPHLIC